jgi:predicted O-methyltransferase YrrM
MEYQDLIFKESNLDANDSISTYNGWGAQQNPHSFEIFYNFLKDVKPSRILEIGTSLGGFTSFLKYSCNRLNIECEIITYDIYGRHEYEAMKQFGIDVRVENVFDLQYTELKQDVIDFIQKDGVTIILCDGGNKKLEFNLLSNFMKKGDFILAHDYADNKEIFDTKIFKKLWNWHEIDDNDISEACERNNLETYNKNEFDKAVWVCKIKK